MTTRKRAIVWDEPRPRWWQRLLHLTPKPRVIWEGEATDEHGLQFQWGTDGKFHIVNERPINRET